MNRTWRIIVTLLCLLAPLPAFAQWKAPAGYAYQPMEGCPVSGQYYAPCEDQMKIFLDAAEKARSENQLVLLVFGADWCPYCRGLNGTLPLMQVLGHKDLKGRILHQNIAVSAIASGKKSNIESGYEVLKLVMSKADKGANMEGIPYMVIVDPKSMKRTSAFNTDGLAAGGLRGTAHDPDKVRLAILKAVAKLKN